MEDSFYSIKKLIQRELKDRKCSQQEGTRTAMTSATIFLTRFNHISSRHKIHNFKFKFEVRIFTLRAQQTPAGPAPY